MKRPKRKKFRVGQTKYHSAFPHIPAIITGKEINGYINVKFNTPVRFLFQNRIIRDWPCSIGCLYNDVSTAVSCYNGGGRP